MPETEPFRLELGVLTRGDPKVAEILDEVSRTLEFRGSGAGGAARASERVDRRSPGASGGGHPRRSQVGTSERVEDVALPGAAEHSLACALGGHLDAEVADLPEHRLRDERTIDPTGRASGCGDLPGQGDQIVVRDPQLRAASAKAGVGVVEDRSHTRPRCSGTDRLGFDPSAQGSTQSVDAHRFPRAGLPREDAEPVLEREPRLLDDGQVADPQLTKGH